MHSRQKRINNIMNMFLSSDPDSSKLGEKMLLQCQYKEFGPLKFLVRKIACGGEDFVMHVVSQINKSTYNRHYVINCSCAWCKKTKDPYTNKFKEKINAIVLKPYGPKRTG